MSASVAASGGLPPAPPVPPVPPMPPVQSGQPGHKGQAGGRDRLLLAVLGMVALVALVVAAARGAQAYHAFQRLHTAQSAPPAVGQPRVQVQDWMPLALVARGNRVPVEALTDALRAAGFTVEPQAVVPDVPGALRGALDRRLGQGSPGSPGSAPPDAARQSQERRRPLPPERQSLRQIAEASGRSPADAVRVAEDAVRDYRQTHSPRPGSAPNVPNAPVAPSTPR